MLCISHAVESLQVRFHSPLTIYTLCSDAGKYHDYGSKFVGKM